MNSGSENKTFEYTYSAKEQEEIARIRSRYVPKAESKIEQLRRLDAQTTRKAAGYAITIGVIGTLIMGSGMSCCLVAPGELMAPGIIVGVIGMAALALAYPLYHHLVRRERERIAPEILRLTDELMK